MAYLTSQQLERRKLLQKQLGATSGTTAHNTTLDRLRELNTLSGLEQSGAAADVAKQQQQARATEMAAEQQRQTAAATAQATADTAYQTQAAEAEKARKKALLGTDKYSAYANMRKKAVV